MPGSERMPHGYTNATSTDGQTVVKRYLGPDVAARQAREVAALVGLAGRAPVPAVLESGDGQIVLELVPGTPGQEALVRAPEAVLRAVGAMAAGLRELDPALAGLTAEPGTRLVHGDFGPQNLVFHRRHPTVAAVVDWELVGVGDPVADVAWAEWIIRTHHPALVGALPALFDGLGERPAWWRRRAAMLAACDRALDFVTRWDPPDDSARRLWLERRAETERFRD